MNFKEYEEKAITTRVYSPKVALPYVVLGLCGETGEFFEKLLKVEARDLVLKEIGDILWYSAAIRVELNLDPIEWPSAKGMDKNAGFLIQANVGVIAEQMKKYLRDDWNEEEPMKELSEDRKQKNHEALTIILQNLQSMAGKYFNVSLEAIAEDNIKKLAKRKANNCLHGSGDSDIR